MASTLACCAGECCCSTVWGCLPDKVKASAVLIVGVALIVLGALATGARFPLLSKQVAGYGLILPGTVMTVGSLWLLYRSCRSNEF